ncbi:MAG TPA: hypothetical protein VFN46_11130 [Acetobacteraceae bacterium]|nr:hypothetical protein [Acetobacteraceae bacterium]
MRLHLAGCLVLLCALAVPPAARAQVESREGIALQNQILQLRQELDSLRQQGPRPGGGGGSSLGGAYQPTPLTPPAAGAADGIEAQLLDRVQRLEESLRELRGQVDDANNTRQRQYDDLNKKIDDLAFRLGVRPAPGAAAGTDGTAGALPATRDAQAGAGQPTTGATLPTPPTPDATAPTPPPVSTPVPVAKRTPEMILKDGNAALARRDYAAAEADAKLVLTNGKGPRATDAQFLLAQTLAGKRDYSAAAVAYDDAYNRNRTGAHAPDSLLGLAHALTSINEKRAACATLDKLRAEFPTPHSDLREPIAQARRNAGCH